MLAVGVTLWRSQGGSCNNEEDKVNGEIFKTAERDKWLSKGDYSFQMDRGTPAVVQYRQNVKEENLKRHGSVKKPFIYS